MDGSREFTRIPFPDFFSLRSRGIPVVGLISKLLGWCCFGRRLDGTLWRSRLRFLVFVQSLHFDYLQRSLAYKDYRVCHYNLSNIRSKYLVVTGSITSGPVRIATSEGSKIAWLKVAVDIQGTSAVALRTRL